MTFDWEPTLADAAEAIIGPRGTDLRVAGDTPQDPRPAPCRIHRAAHPVRGARGCPRVSGSRLLRRAAVDGPSSVIRPLVAHARRVVVKVGSSSLTTAAGGLDAARVDALVDTLAVEKRDIVLVSSGAISAGIAPLGLARRPRDLATLQACASVGQLLLAERYAASFGRYSRAVGQVLLTSEDVIRRAHYRNARRTLERLLDLGVVPVLNENDAVATEEIRFSGNDRLAALVAHLVAADLLILLTDVAGRLLEQSAY